VSAVRGLARARLHPGRSRFARVSRALRRLPTRLC